MEHFPIELCSLIKLETINLANNCIEDVPEEIKVGFVNNAVNLHYIQCDYRDKYTIILGYVFNIKKCQWNLSAKDEIHCCGAS